MTPQRLALALDAGLFDWPDGPIVAYRPDPELTGLPLDRTQIQHEMRTAFTSWDRRGGQVAPNVSGQFAGAYIAVPRAKEHARQLLAQAIDCVGAGGFIAVDGQKTDGVDSVIKLLRGLLVDMDSYAKAHGKLVWGRLPDPLPEAAASLRKVPQAPEGWTTAPSGFSAGAVDPGSALLVANLPKGMRGDVLDLGAGWGFLAKSLLAQSDVSEIDLVEANFDALEAARSNISDARARFLWEDAAVFAPGKRYDAVISNPPFHTSRKADPALGQMFVRCAARVLKPSGVLALVANRHLPYEQTLAESFADIRTVIEDHGYKIIHARKPKLSGASRAT